MGPEVELLEHHAEVLAQFLDLFAAGGGAVGAQGDLFAANDDAAGGRRFQKVDATQHGRFARTRAADDRHHIAFVRGQRDALQNLQRAKGFAQAVDADGLGRAGAGGAGGGSLHGHPVII